ncbi:MAG: hypothetical protein KAV82_08965 [Phycisphaerae bacterium]|nr:hypothetical protein [Phycisphaerae bacterium]
MSESGPEPTSPQSDVYTVLLVVATLFLAAATVFIAIQAQQFFGRWLPLNL